MRCPYCLGPMTVFYCILTAPPFENIEKRTCKECGVSTLMPARQFIFRTPDVVTPVIEKTKQRAA